MVLPLSNRKSDPRRILHELGIFSGRAGWGTGLRVNVVKTNVNGSLTGSRPSVADLCVNHAVGIELDAPS
jgi:hypothetical protein